MRVFVYEHLCASRTAGPEAEGLRAEGWGMLSSLLRDLGRCRDVQPVVQVAPPLFARVKGLDVPVAAHLTPPGEEEAAFRALARNADFALVIAPEFDNLLFQRVEWAEQEGPRLLGPSSEAVRLTGDKLALAEHLQRQGVPTPPVGQASSLVLGDRTSEDACPTFVCKPRYGAGSQATFLVRDPDELASCPARALAEGWRGELIVQPYVPGLAVSVAFLARPGRLIALPPAEQSLSRDGRSHYLGGRLPLPPDLAERATSLAERAVRTVPGLRGYFGVDLVLGETADVVLEINPRLTTSYVGLRALARTNLAEALLAVVVGRAPHLDWRRGAVRFWADGRLEE
jgi:predicted ATP-grasp superfamily ATP-dependent carboligase